MHGSCNVPSKLAVREQIHKPIT